MQSPSLFEVVGYKGTNHQYVYVTERSLGSDPIESSFCKDNREKSNAQNVLRVMLSIHGGMLKAGLAHPLL